MRWEIIIENYPKIKIFVDCLPLEERLIFIGAYKIKPNETIDMVKIERDFNVNMIEIGKTINEILEKIEPMIEQYDVIDNHMKTVYSRIRIE